MSNGPFNIPVKLLGQLHQFEFFGFLRSISQVLFSRYLHTVHFGKHTSEGNKNLFILFTGIVGFVNGKHLGPFFKAPGPFLFLSGLIVPVSGQTYFGTWIDRGVSCNRNY